ncbi:hypothetical protein [Qipengyuania sediminis]|uniref:hypothetical protein n=1 Tax=Qipengyuania sediminis TaxID=1532023 RepID=UPI0010596CFF|nr:hypothetical protein [Qipengyuania sediminis]
MAEPTIVIAAAALIGLITVVAALLKGWQDWLALKSRELEARGSRPATDSSQLGAARIELSDLKERIRKLEAIASGVDL